MPKWRQGSVRVHGLPPCAAVWTCDGGPACLLAMCEAVFDMPRASVSAAAGSPPSRSGTVQQGSSDALLAARVTQLWPRSVPSLDEALRPAPARPRAAAAAPPARPDAAAGRGRPDVSRLPRPSKDARDGAGTGRPSGGRPARSSGEVGEVRATRTTGWPSMRQAHTLGQGPAAALSDSAHAESPVLLACATLVWRAGGVGMGVPSGRGRDYGAWKRRARRGVSAGCGASGERARSRCGSASATCSAGRMAGGACPRVTGTTPT